MNEAAIQKAVVKNLRDRGVPGAVWFHPANGGKRGAREASQFKNMGVRKGVSDIIAIHRGCVYALELKAPKGNATVEQMQFISDINAAGGFGCIASGLDQAIKVLEAWGILKGRTQ